MVERPVLFTLDVDLGGGRSGVVVARSGDQPHHAALNFFEDEGIEPREDVLKAMIHTIQERMDKRRKFRRNCLKHELGSHEGAPPSPLRERR